MNIHPVFYWWRLLIKVRMRLLFKGDWNPRYQEIRSKAWASGVYKKDCELIRCCLHFIITCFIGKGCFSQPFRLMNLKPSGNVGENRSA